MKASILCTLKWNDHMPVPQGHRFAFAESNVDGRFASCHRSADSNSAL